MKKIALVNSLVAALIVVALASPTWAQAPADLPVVKNCRYQQIE